MPDYTYDVALSFAGEDRPYVERVAALLRDSAVRVFYDDYEQANLWGKNLYQHLDEVYRKQARYCVAFLSAAYARKLWTRQELADAQARAFTENREYILPARFDDTEIPGILPVVSYIDLRKTSPEMLTQLIVDKLQSLSSACQATVRAGLPEAIQRAEHLLASPEASERNKGVIALRSMDSAAAADALAKALGSPFRQVRIQSALALAHRRDNRLIDLLVDLFTDEHFLWLDLESALDGLSPDDRQAVLARAIGTSRRRVLRYLNTAEDIGVPHEAFSSGLAKCIDSEGAGERAAAIILARKFGVRNQVLPHLVAAMQDERPFQFDGFGIQAGYAPRVCDQAAVTISELGILESLNSTERALWETRRHELANYTRSRRSNTRR